MGELVEALGARFGADGGRGSFLCARRRTGGPVRRLSAVERPRSPIASDFATMATSRGLSSARSISQTHHEGPRMSLALPQTPSLRLDGRRALVTGGGRGIGVAVCAALAQAGAHVVVAARSRDEIEGSRTRSSREGGSASALALDVTDVAAVARALEDQPRIRHSRQQRRRQSSRTIRRSERSRLRLDHATERAFRIFRHAGCRAPLARGGRRPARSS